MCQLQDHRKAKSSLNRNSQKEQSSDRSKMQRVGDNNNYGAGRDH